ncbi:MAG: uracil-DNA glycosylase, partial [Tepidiformaceae bacterium]
ALAALGRIEAHGLALSNDVGRRVPWAGRTLLPLYHPGRQAQLHRQWALQLEDWRALGSLIGTGASGRFSE